MKVFLPLIFFASFQNASALETDNYLIWNHELKDSRSYINQFFSEHISDALQGITDHTNKTCAEMTVGIAKKFASKLVHDNPVENWLFRVLSATEIFPADLYYVEESIYRHPLRPYIPWFGLAPNIQVNGYYFGTDKLSHFASTGMIYFKIFQNERTSGTDLRTSEEKAIDWGIRDEKSVHGYWASGVFSFADLEANYQGLQFYRRFCESPRPYLKRETSGSWVLSIAPDIKEFVSGYWDESFELSYLLPENWKLVAPVLHEKYCSMRNMKPVTERMSYYRKTSPNSFSRQYLKLRKSSRTIPDPDSSQSFISLCSKGR